MLLNNIYEYQATEIFVTGYNEDSILIKHSINETALDVLANHVIPGSMINNVVFTKNFERKFFHFPNIFNCNPFLFFFF